MTIILTILKWIGIILLVVLVILLLLLLLVLFVPIRYKLRAAVNDPESHEEFPLNVLKEQSDVMAEVTWFWGILKVLVQYPGEKLLDIRIFGKSLPIGGGGEEKEEATGEPEKEEKEEEEKEEDAESVIGRIGRLFDKADYYWRVITGRCGRRATDKIISAVKNIVLHVIPQAWKVRGTLGLSDPCLNGKISGGVLWRHAGIVGGAILDRSVRTELGKNAYETIEKYWNADNAARRFLENAKSLLDTGKAVYSEREEVTGALQPMCKDPEISPRQGERFTRRY